MRVTRVQLLAIIAAAVALLVVAVAAGSTATHPFTSTATGGPGQTAPAQPNPPKITAVAASGTPDGTPGGGAANTDWLRLVLIVALVVAGGFGIRRLANIRWSPWGGTRPPQPAAPPANPDSEAPEELRDAIDDGLESLERGPVSEAIIACWVRVESAVAEVGVPLRPSETSTELADRVLASYGVRESTLRRLAALYREARFSSHAMGEANRREARTCLTGIQSDLARRHAAT